MFDYGYKDTAAFSYFQFFFNFFSLYAKIPIYAGFPSSLFRWCPVFSRVARGVLTIIYTLIYTRIHVRSRGFLDHNF